MNFCRVFLVLVLLCASGCALVTRLPPEPGAKTPEGEEIVETVQVMNSSWSLFCLLPLASGNVDSPDRVSCIPFRDSVNLQNQLKMIEAAAEREMEDVVRWALRQPYPEPDGMEERVYV